jgi:hypothetical protein
MTDVNHASNVPLTAGAAGDDMSSFYSEVDTVFVSVKKF